MKLAKLPCAYQLGAVVYLRMATDRRPGMIVAVRFIITGGCLYAVAWGNASDSMHYEAELSTARSFALPETEEG